MNILCIVYASRRQSVEFSFLAGTLITGDYWVVNASYDKYALVFGCREWNEDNVCVESDSWIWSRIPTLDSVTMAMLETVADNLCINVTNYLSTRQTNGGY